MDFNLYNYPPNGGIISRFEEDQRIQLNANKGQKLVDDATICAYDESVNRFRGLEGTAFLTSHSLVVHGSLDYIPVNLLTFNFYTRSDTLFQNSKFIKRSEDPETDSKKDYVLDRSDFLVANVPENSVLFIDGPIIGRQMTSYTFRLNRTLLRKGIIPVFFVKNSTSNLLTDNIRELRGKYNSDMHWAYASLREGERTSLFKYVDRCSKQHAKVFCYLKTLDVSPHRIEVDMETFELHSERIMNLFNLIHYLLLVQGDLRNPQIRPIAIAEKYARATLNLINLVETMRRLGITPTMNQERFAW